MIQPAVLALLLTASLPASAMPDSPDAGSSVATPTSGIAVSDAAESDAGTRGAAKTEATTSDAGLSGNEGVVNADAGTSDSGTSRNAGAVNADAGTSDAGTAGNAGNAGAGNTDAGTSDSAVMDAAPLDAGTSEALAAPSSAPTPSTLKNVGVLTGVVQDAETGEALIDASVSVLSGPKRSTRTDVDGRFTLELPPGTYDLRAYYELYEPKRISGVVLKAGEETRLELALGSTQDVTEQIVVVEAKADTRSEGALLQQRRESVVVQDAVSAEEISRTPDANASDAVKRVVSATVIDGKYVLLRGLGGRYVTTLLNGVTLPSPDPDSQAVPLDLFPTSLLANLTVLKSYDPAYPATFGGGALLIETNAYPSSFEFKPRLSLSGNTQSTFQLRQSYEGGSMDWLGFDDGSRALPGSVPNDTAVVAGRNGVTREQVETIGESFNNRWSLGNQQTIPNASLGATIGDTLRSGSTKLGYLATLSWGHRETIRRATTAKARIGSGGVEERESLDSLIGTESATLGALLNTGLHLSNDSELEFFALYTHAGEDRAESVTGFSETDAQPLDVTRLQFVERSLAFGQLGGFHRVLKNVGSNGVELRWKTNLSGTTRLEPDTRDTTYNIRPDGRSVFKNEPGSGERFFSTLQDQSYGALLDARLPFERVTLRTGASAQRTTRNFSARRFRFNFVGNDPGQLFLAPEELFSPEQIGPTVRLQERTLATDAYTASRDVIGGFVAADWKVIDPLRLSGGVRYESSHQRLTPGTPFSITGAPPAGVDRTDGTFLPSASASYAITDAQALRASYSFTLARPEFRELAPFLYFDFARRRSVSGNPDLEQTRIHNLDLRYELFPSSEEVFAVSVFGKQFIAPIEQVIVSTSQGDVGYANAESALALGAEFEGRVALARVSEKLSDFRLSANLTLIRSEVTLAPEQLGAQTNANRPLQGQSPYIANLGVLWSPSEKTEVSALYNVQGPRILEVGFQGLPDVYERAFHRVDLTLSHRLESGMKLKGSVVNLLNQEIALDQGDVTVLRYRPGVSASLSAELSF